MINISLISFIIIYANIFIQYLTDMFFLQRLYIFLAIHWYFDWIRFIDARGKAEVGRGDGVARDIYSSFCIYVSNSHWSEKKNTICSPWFVQKEILAKEFNDTRYFPTMISKSFVQYCFYGEVSNNELMSSF